MAKIAALILALEASAVPEHKALAAEARTQFGDLLEVDASEVRTRVQKGDAAITQVADLSKQVKDLDEKAKGSDTLRASVEGYETRERPRLIATELGAKAKEFGLRAEAIPTVLKIADLSAIKVDPAKGTITGLTKELFDGLKKEHPLIAAPAEQGTTTVTPPPPANGGANAQAAAPKLEGAFGGFLSAIKS